MSQTPTRSEPPDSEHRGLPMVVAQPGEPQEGWLTRVMRILFGWKAAATRADLEHVLTAEQPQSGFSPEEAVMLKNILGLRETRIERIMIPRADIVAVQQDIALGDLVKVFEVAGHSRLVVYNDTLDDPTGMIHIRDLIAFMAAHATQDPAAAQQGQSHTADLNFANIDLGLPLTAAKIVREILYAPPSMPALDLLAKMQATRIHLALVIDEYGGTDGLVSMEDLVELIVGDIADEHDEREMPAVTRQSDGSFLATGRASLDVIRAGHVPVRGELVPGPETFEAEVLDADPRRVKRARIYRRKDRRPAAARELPVAVKTPPTPPAAARPASSPRDEANRPSTNTQPTP